VEYDPQAGPEASAADAWVVPAWALPRWAAAGRLRPVPKPLTQPENPYGWTELLPMFGERLLVWDRVAYGLPLLGESPVCCYRADLFGEGAHQEGFAKKYSRRPAPPRTWEEFADLAEYFRDARKAPSLPPLPADDDGLDREFFAVAAAYARRAVSQEEAPRGDVADDLFSFHYDHRTGRPRVDAPGFVYALKLLQRLQACRPKGPAADPAEALRTGAAVLGLADVPVVASFQRSPLRDKWGVCRVPGGGRFFDYKTGQERPAPEGSNRVPYLGASAWVAVVPTSAADPDAAFGLLADLSGRERSGQVVIDPRWGGGAVRRDHFDRTRWDAFGLDPTRTRDLKEALRETVLHPRLKNPAFRLRTPDEAPREKALLAEVRAALEKGGDPARALAAAARRWDELDRAEGPPKHLAEYRISLGLLPSGGP
jgi:multiple sugar transport system substrate-binding protein